MSRLLPMYDSVTLEGVQGGRSGVQLVAGYINGGYPSYGAMEAYYKPLGIPIISISVVGQTNAWVLDCETGDYTPQAAAEVAIQQLKSQAMKPTIYGGLDYLQAVIRELQARRYSAHAVDWWVAHYTQVETAAWVLPVTLPDVVPGLPASAWQFANSSPTTSGHSYDVSAVDEAWARRHGWRDPHGAGGGPTPHPTPPSVWIYGHWYDLRHP